MGTRAGLIWLVIVGGAIGWGTGWVINFVFFFVDWSSLPKILMFTGAGIGGVMMVVALLDGVGEMSTSGKIFTAAYVAFLLLALASWAIGSIF